MSFFSADFVSTLKDLTAGTIGACSGIVAGQPFDTIKVRMQASSSTYSGALDCLLKTVRHEGPLALYKGMASPLIGNAPLNAIVFGCNGSMNRLLDKYFPRTHSLSSSPDYFRLYASATYGGLAQCVVCTPVELIKCKLQMQGINGNAQATADIPRYAGALDCVRQTYSRTGFRGLYRGWWSTVWRDAPSYGAWFVSYEWVKYQLTPRGESTSTAIMLLAGGVAGIVTWSVTYPLDVIKSVVQTMPDHTPRQQLTMAYIARKHYNQEGFRWFFKGLTPTLIRAIPTSAVTFYVYEKCQQAMK